MSYESDMARLLERKKKALEWGDPIAILDAEQKLHERMAAVSFREEARKGGTVRPGPWPGSGGQVAKFAFPGFDEQGETEAPAPTAIVPELPVGTDAGAGGEVARPPAIPCPPVGVTLADTNVSTVAHTLLAVIDKRFPGFAYDGGEFWVYRDGAYSPLPEWWLLSAAKQYDGLHGASNDGVFRANVTNLRSVETLVGLDLKARQNLPKDASYFDESPALAVFANGALIVDANGQPRWVKHSPDHRARFRYDFDYESGLVPRHFLAVARDWFRGLPEAEFELTILALRQFGGHVLLNSLWRKKLSAALMLVGKGHDGKSTFINLLRALLPPGSTTELDPSALGAKSATVDLARAALFGKQANICDDVSSETWGDVSFLKRVLDHAPVQARKIGGDSFSFRARLSSVFAANELPRLTDRSWGFLRRWLLIQFPNSIPMDKRDPRLEQKILGHERRELACWFIDAALAMLADGGPSVLAEPACHQELLGQWAANGDSVSGFIDGATIDAGAEKADWTPVEDLYESYRQWGSHVFGEFHAAREIQSKAGFARAIRRHRGVQLAVLGKNRTRVINRKVGTNG